MSNTNNVISTSTTIARKRGRPLGSGKPKVVDSNAPKKTRGRPPGSKNRVKLTGTTTVLVNSAGNATLTNESNGE